MRAFHWSGLLAVAMVVFPSWAEAQTLLERLEQRLREPAEPVPEPLPLPVPPRTAPAPGVSSEPALLGVVVAPLTLQVIQQRGLVVREGALVTFVETGSPADLAKIAAGDVIVAVDGVRIDSPRDLIQLIRSSRAGQKVEVAYYVGDRLYRKQLTLGGRTGAVPDASLLPPPEPQPPPDASPPRLRSSRSDRGGRPLIDRLNGVLEGLITPEPALRPAAGETPVPQVPEDGQIEELRKQIKLLSDQIQQLKDRITELESAVEGAGTLGGRRDESQRP